eukprot:119605-Pleurochrysis_carterae.AAC.1
MSGNSSRSGRGREGEEEEVTEHWRTGWIAHSRLAHPYEAVTAPQIRGAVDDARVPREEGALLLAHEQARAHAQTQERAPAHAHNRAHTQGRMRAEAYNTSGGACAARE